MFKFLRYTCLFLLCSSTIFAESEKFNLSQELNMTNNIEDTFELISAYSNIIENVHKNTSTRLSKKLLKLVQNLHTICTVEEDNAVKIAYRNLLESAIANEKLTSIDYTNELPLLLESYEEFDPKNKEKEGDEELWGDVVPDAEIVVAEDVDFYEKEPRISSEQREKLYGATPELNRNIIIPRLALRRIISETTKLTRDLGKMQKEIDRLAIQDDILKRIYKKLDKIEKLMLETVDNPFFPKGSPSMKDLMRYPVQTDSETKSPVIDEDFEDYSPLLQKLILENSQE